MEDQTPSKKRIYLVLGAIFFGLILIILYARTTRISSNNLKNISPSPQPTVTVAKETGKIFFKSKNDIKVVTVNDTISLTVFADSSNNPITGFDIVVKYDSQIVNFLNATGLQKQYDLHTQKGTNTLSFTGVLKISSEALAFNNAPLVELSFKPQKSGEAKFLVEFEPGSKKDSNLITTTNADVLGVVEDIRIAIGTTLTLNKNTKKLIPGSDVALTLTEVTIPDAQCRDCITYAKIVVEKEKQQKTVEFQEGGFTGEIRKPQEAFEYVINLDTFNKNSVIVNVYNKG